MSIKMRLIVSCWLVTLIILLGVLIYNNTTKKELEMYKKALYFVVNKNYRTYNVGEPISALKSGGKFKITLEKEEVIIPKGSLVVETQKDGINTAFFVFELDGKQEDYIRNNPPYYYYYKVPSVNTR